ncbi:hypothetical protein [Muricoccus aerilatus]|nr:hypothetical protein [Roseomonas aerilata]
MADLFWLTRAQVRRIAPLVLLSRGVPRVDDERVVSVSLRRPGQYSEPAA